MDLISYYCSKSKKNYEDYAKEYIENVLVLMNDSDNSLLEKVTVCLNSIYEGLSKESQFQLVPIVKGVIQSIAVEDIRMGGIYRKKVDTLKLFEKASGIRNIVAVI